MSSEDRLIRCCW